MVIHKTISNRLVTLIVFLSIVFIGLIINWAKANMDNAVIDTTLSEMDKVGNQVKVLLEETIKENIDDLSLLTDYISRYEIEEEYVIDFLKTQSQVEEFTSLYYVNTTGHGVTVDGSTFDFSTNTAYLNALESDYSLSNPYISLTDDTMVFDIAVPVVIESKTVGVLISQISIENFYQFIELNTDGTGDVFIVDYDLNLLLSTSSNHTGSTLMPEGDISEIGLANVGETKENFISGKSGGFYYEYYGVSKAIVYHPIDFTDWVLAMNVEINTFSAVLTDAVEQFKNVCGIVYWTIIALVFYVSFAQYHYNKVLIKTAYYDSLTGLPNLEKFKILVAEKIKKNPDIKFTMQKMDIEKFSVVNEVFGMDTGDRVLTNIAEIMNSISSDIEETFVCAKVGVDEFIMFAGNGYLDRDETTRTDDESRLKELMPELGDYELSFRYGRYFIEQGDTDVMGMITKTTMAHRMAKANIHQKTWNYDDEYRQTLRENTELNNKRRSAMDKKEFKVFLQPKFSTNDHKLVGAEALVRWIEADGTMNYPNDFIPLFEKNGFIVELDSYILENICMTIKAWIDKGYDVKAISVNCSRMNLETPYFVEDIISVVDKYKVPHEYIEFELTESTTIANEHIIGKLFADLRKHNFKISIDDFGAGHSSLGMLKNLQVDVLKMDRSFFNSPKHTERDNMLIDSIVKMAHNLDMYVVAEGIEHTEQVEFLKKIKCDAIQGYVYAKPMPIDEFENKYIKN